MQMQGGNQQMYQQMYGASGPGQGCGGCMAPQGQQGQQQSQQQPSQQQMSQGQMMAGCPQMMMAGCPQQGQMMMVPAAQGGGQCGGMAMSGMNMGGPMAKFPGPQQQ